MILVLLEGCSSFKHRMIQSGSRNEAIHNAILDFSKTGSLYRADSVFSVSFYDTMGRMVLDINQKWIKGQPYEGIVAVTIVASGDRFLVTKDPKVDSKKGYLPSRFIEKEGKLFYWWDDDSYFTEETLAVLEKYDLLRDEDQEVITIPDFIIDDELKGTHYYFCKENLSKYKKVISSKGIGYYNAPSLKCNY